MIEEMVSLESSYAEIERVTGLSDWSLITQEQIDSFAEVTGDHQWIHKSSPQIFATPFGGPVAHGLLVLSLALRLAMQSGVLADMTWVVCGYDKLRFRSPVRPGNWIRCRATVLDTSSIGARSMSTVRLEVEVQGEKMPALIADCSLLCLPAEPTDSRVMIDG